MEVTSKRVHYELAIGVVFLSSLGFICCKDEFSVKVRKATSSVCVLFIHNLHL